MTIPEMFDVIDAHIKEWQEDEIIALRQRDPQRAREIRLRVAAIERLATALHEKAAA